VVGADSTLLAAWGDIERPIYPRSAVKPLQALPLIESGAADRFGLTQRELALACASHLGEGMHVQAVAAWLARLGLTPDDLECGPHMPINAEAAAGLIRSGKQPEPLHNNCSGKHTGVLTTLRHQGLATADYRLEDHPAQRRIRDTIGEMAAHDMTDAPWGVDGCAMPNYALPLVALARAAARFARPEGLGAVRAEACRRLAAAMRAEPLYVGGHGRFDSLIMGRTPGRFVVKTGAEGVYFAADPERGLGIALKIDDGTSRAAVLAVAHLLAHFGIVERSVLPGLLASLTPIANTRGEAVGVLRPAAGWLEAAV
jgi:L-asparaginase II